MATTSSTELEEASADSLKGLPFNDAEEGRCMKEWAGTKPRADSRSDEARLAAEQQRKGAVQQLSVRLSD